MQAIDPSTLILYPLDFWNTVIFDGVCSNGQICVFQATVGTERGDGLAARFWALIP
jgi:hypothetical protein